MSFSPDVARDRHDHVAPSAMTAHLQPRTTTSSSPEDDAQDLKARSRSPHPYHRQQSELLEPSDRLIYRVNAATPGATDLPSPVDSNAASNSGTDADDEHFLKGLPAPKVRLHKGLRGVNEPLSASSTPLLSPAILEDEVPRSSHTPTKNGLEREKRVLADRIRRRKEVIRRVTEVLLLACQAAIVASNKKAQPFLKDHGDGFAALGLVFLGLLAVYPLRLVIWAYRNRTPPRPIPVRVPSSFDPASFLYPPFIPIIVSLLVAQNVEGVVSLNLVLSLCALPRTLVPGARYWETYSWSHWLLSCLPAFFDAQASESGRLPQELLVLLYPLHQTLCLLLQQLTTTSLLIAELQLLSVALINVLILAHSPQALILKAVLWGGGLGILISCGQVIQWGISLARVPKWRFRRVPATQQQKPGLSILRALRSFRTLYRRSRYEAAMMDYDSDGGFSDSGISAVHNDQMDGPSSRKSSALVAESMSMSDTEAIPSLVLNSGSPPQAYSPRRHTLHSLTLTGSNSNKAKSTNRSFKSSTPSGRRKRSASYSVRAFFSLTQSQAQLRKWIYAVYVLLCILGTILLGVRTYVQRYALAGGEEPIGWALGYMFGDLNWFRFQVVQAGLERWILLPSRNSEVEGLCASGGSGAGWVQHLRHSFLGEANTRLLLSGYFLGIIIVGLAVVFRLSPVYEVDTRRKVFHFMMVAMLLPCTFIDPGFITLALVLVLAIFLLLDLVRASQLPPLSKPIARFLTPYVDGRDLRGPVVISHIFLLVGCAVPLWLSMASLPRSTQNGTRTGNEEARKGPLEGWEVPARELSMVSGIVCVGLGDAAASLIGRRWGRRKWLWGGGKSIEGSLAFAAAVWVGLMASNIWLHLGGWPLSESVDFQGQGAGFVKSLMPSLGRALGKESMINMAICAAMASLTEAVLTGGNDNVVVPVVLWTCVKGIGV
ncbi:hypothetical protein V8F06_004652 [Rhypophila decipiens]